MKKTITKFLAYILTLIIVIFTISGCGKDTVSQPAEKEESKTADFVLNIDNKAPVNDDFCFSAVYMCYPYMPDSTAEVYTEKDIEIEYARLKSAGIKRVRTVFKASWCWDAEKDCWDWDTVYMKAVYKWLEDMAEMGIEVVFNMQWNFSELTAEIDKMNLENPFYTLTNGGKYDDVIPHYAKWTEDTIKEVIIKRNHSNIKYMILITEPNHQTYFKDNGYDVVPNTYSQFEQWVKLPKAVDAQLKKAGIRERIKIVGPCTTYLCDDFLKWTIEEADQYIDVYGHHLYAYSGDIYNDVYTTSYDWFVKISEMIKATGKEFWEDEYSFNRTGGSMYELLVSDENSWHGTQMASLISAMLNGGADAGIVWTLADQKWPEYLQGTDGSNDSWVYGVQKNGMLPYMKQSTIPRASWYAFSMIGKYLKGDSNIIYAGEHKKGISTTMWKNSKGEVNILCVNQSISDNEMTLQFAESLGGVKLYRHVYDPTTIDPSPLAKEIASDKEFENVETDLTDTITAGQVILYTTRAD